MERETTTKSLASPLITKGISYKRVLCWVDSTEDADLVVAVAQALVATCDGKCHVVMGLDCPARSNRALGNGRSGSIPLTPEVIAKTESRLASLYGDDVSTMVLPGKPITEIRRYARNKKMDLIAIGNQGLAVERAYGEQLHENAPCPVMTLFIPKPANDAQRDFPGA